MKKNIKIGLIQTSPLSADFSANLRNIVQAYRDCIDRGAQLVIAPAYALTGPQLFDLSQRASFLQQNQLALETLAKEIAHAPLIIASYSTALTGFDVENLFGILDAQDFEIDAPSILCPFILEDGEITQLEEGEETEILGLKLYVEVGDDESATDIPELDALIRLSTASWHAGMSRSNEDSRRWEAQINNCAVINMHSFGYAEHAVYAGGSCFYNEQGTPIHRMPFFETAQSVISLGDQVTARSLPKEEELLRQALTCCLRDYTRNMGYVGLCLNLDLPNSELLALLAAEVLGAQKVHALSFEQSEVQAQESLGIQVKQVASALTQELKEQLSFLQDDSEPELVARLKAAIISSYAEQEGLALISPLGRHQLLLGEFTPDAESCGKLLPFGGLYEMDLYLLCQHLSEERPNYFGALAEPQRPQIDRILHRTQDCNLSSNTLIQESEGLLLENDVRYVQRRVLCSAEKRVQIPPVLALESHEERLRFPICHRLND